MASYDPEFYEPPKSAPGYDDARPGQRGCFFYGCVIAGVLSVLLIIAWLLGGYLAYRALLRLPRAIHLQDADGIAQGSGLRGAAQRCGRPVQGVPPGGQRWDRDRAAGPVRGRPQCAGRRDSPKLKGRVFFTVGGEKIKGQVSIPLDVFMDTSLTRPISQRRGGVQGVALGRRAGRDPGLARGQREAVSRTAHGRPAQEEPGQGRLQESRRTPR